MTVEFIEKWTDYEGEKDRTVGLQHRDDLQGQIRKKTAISIRVLYISLFQLYLLKEGTKKNLDSEIISIDSIIRRP